MPKGKFTLFFISIKHSVGVLKFSVNNLLALSDRIKIYISLNTKHKPISTMRRFVKDQCLKETSNSLHLMKIYFLGSL